LKHGAIRLRIRAQALAGMDSTLLAGTTYQEERKAGFRFSWSSW
jgi:hypothetical protein